MQALVYSTCQARLLAGSFVWPPIGPRQKNPKSLALREALYVAEILGIFGSGGRDRTYDQLINSQLLYR